MQGNSTGSQDGFRPLSGNLLSLQLERFYELRKKEVFVPYRGIYFLYHKERKMKHDTHKNVFVPYRGIYFLYEGEKTMVRTKIGFRPLSGNLLSLRQVIRLEEKYALVFVPYRGIYFLYPVQDNTEGGENKVFVPYRGIYFLYYKMSCNR